MSFLSRNPHGACRRTGGCLRSRSTLPWNTSVRMGTSSISASNDRRGKVGVLVSSNRRKLSLSPGAGTPAFGFGSLRSHRRFACPRLRFVECAQAWLGLRELEIGDCNRASFALCNYTVTTGTPGRPVFRALQIGKGLKKPPLKS